MLKLYGASASPFVRKVMAVLAIKEVPYEHIPSMPFSGDEELARVSPLQKVPALIDGDLNIADSKVICRYLESAYPEVPVYPTDPQQRARADWFEEYGGTVLAESALQLPFATLPGQRVCSGGPGFTSERPRHNMHSCDMTTGGGTSIDPKRKHC